MPEFVGLFCHVIVPKIGIFLRITINICIFFFIIIIVITIIISTSIAISSHVQNFVFDVRDKKDQVVRIGKLDTSQQLIIK